MTFPKKSSGQVIIKGDSCKYEVFVLQAKSYPRPEMPFPEDTIKVSGICDLYGKTVSSVATNTEKSFLTGIHLEIYSDCIEAFGCDGTRIAVKKLSAETGGQLSLTIPKSSFSYLANAVKDEDVLNVGMCGNHIVFFMENLIFSTRFISEDYINTEVLLNSLNSDYTATVDSKKLEIAITMIMACINSSNSESQVPRVNMRFLKDEIIFKAANDISSSHVPVYATISKPTPASGFWYNPISFADCFYTVSGEVKLHLDASGILLVESTDSKYMLSNVHIRGSKSKTTTKKAA